MACCMIERYGIWCKNEKTVYIDPKENKEYCIFHAPKGMKGKTVEGFNELVFAKIEKVIEENKKEKEKKAFCDLSRTVFEGDISFSGFNENNPLPRISFYGATFSGKADFHRTVFSETASFWEATFSGEASFIFAFFFGETSFMQATFSGITRFGLATFSKTAEANFDLATFSRAVYYFGATFPGEASFRQATFSGEADFRQATFSKAANFFNATFKKRTVFRGKEDGKEETGVKDVIKKGDFRDISIEGSLLFENIDLSEVSFLDTDLRKIDFVNVDWAKIPGRPSRDVLYDENTLGKKPKKDDISKVELLYRRLKQKYIDEHDWPEVSNWHYGEKEMFRKGSPWRRYNPFSLSNLFWASCGYAERPVRAGVVLVLLIFFLSIFLGFSGLEVLKGIQPPDGIHSIKIESWKDLIDLSKLPLFLITTLQYATFDKNPTYIPITTFGWYINMLAKILIPLQTAFFALAVRNKFRR